MSTTTSNFGESEYGSRLSYEKTETGCMAGWRDKGWAILYYIHVLIMTGLAIYMPIQMVNNGINFGNNNSSSTIVIGATPAPTSAPTTAATNDLVSALITGVIIIFLTQCVIGAIFGLIWLKVIQKFASIIIKAMLFFQLFMYLVVIGVGFMLFNQGESLGLFLMIIGAILFIIFGLYIYCVWDRIPFTSALLVISSKITQTFEGTICVSLLVIPINIIWYMIWEWSFVGYTATNGGNVDFVVYLLLISMYWGFNVNINISHVTTCGVAATWYFSKEVHKPTMPAFKRTITTSFGSICFGSFIIAVLQATRTILRMVRERAGIAACIIDCILACIQRLVEIFNLYSFAQCAIYGCDYLTAARATKALFYSKGFLAIIQVHLSGLALFCGAFLTFIICFFVGFFMAGAFFPPAVWGIWSIILQIVLGFYGGILGYCMAESILVVVQSAIVCLFVCFAEDPNAMKNNRPEEYQSLIQASDPLNQYATQGHTGVEPQ